MREPRPNQPPRPAGGGPQLRFAALALALVALAAPAGAGAQTLKGGAAPAKAAPEAPKGPAETAKGTIDFKGRTATIRFAYLVRGPDLVTGKPVRRLILSATDLAPATRLCQTMACVRNALGEGIAIDLAETPKLAYWLTLNNQRVQHTAAEDRAALKFRTNDAKRAAGTLGFDRSGAGGPKVSVEFDAPLWKELAKP